MRTAVPEVTGTYAATRRYTGDSSAGEGSTFFCRLYRRQNRETIGTGCVSDLQQSTSRDHLTIGLSADCIRYLSHILLAVVSYTRFLSPRKLCWR